MLVDSSGSETHIPGLKFAYAFVLGFHNAGLSALAHSCHHAEKMVHCKKNVI